MSAIARPSGHSFKPPDVRCCDCRYSFTQENRYSNPLSDPPVGVLLLCGWGGGAKPAIHGCGDFERYPGADG